MDMKYDKYHRINAPKITLLTPFDKPLSVLTGIDVDSFSLTPSLMNTQSVTFDVYEYMEVKGRQVKSIGYDLLSVKMVLNIEGVGRFIMESPSVHHDGRKQYKSITAQSCEIEMQQHDVKGLKINKGTTDSYELSKVNQSNIIYADTVEIPAENIKFYNPNKPSLSLLDILLEPSVSGIHGWSVGYVDDSLHSYKEWNDEKGEYETKYKLLADEVGSFDITNQDLYSLLTQTIAQYFQVVFTFDIINKKINAYRPESVGQDTNIHISFRNIENSNDITVDDENLFTRLAVNGANNLGITYVNYGENIIERISPYFLNEKYLSKSTIEKYKIWQQDYENTRTDWIANTRMYNQQLGIISDLMYRVPFDGLMSDWKSYSTDELYEEYLTYIRLYDSVRATETFWNEDGVFDEAVLQEKDIDIYREYIGIKDSINNIKVTIYNRWIGEEYSTVDLKTKLEDFKAELRGYEEKYVDEDNNFDEEVLRASKDSKRYYLVKDAIIPIFEYVIDLRGDKDILTTDDELEYLESYKTDWDLYGTVELGVKISEYRNIRSLAVSGGYNIPYEDSDAGHSETVHNKNYEKYLDAVYNLDGEQEGSCQSVLDIRKKQVEDAQAIADEFQEARLKNQDSVKKELWQHDDYSFTSEELNELSKLYIDGEYSNDNILTTDLDDTVSTINVQLQLLADAEEQMSIVSEPQYTYTTTIDNLFTVCDYPIGSNDSQLIDVVYKNYINSLNIGNFLYLGVTDTEVVKLRLVEMTYNPFVQNSNVELVFSNMIKSASGRDDFSYLLSAASNVSKNSVSGSSSSGNGDVTATALSTGLIQKLLNSNAFSNKVEELVGSGLIIAGSANGSVTLTVEELRAKLVEATKIVADDGYFDYLSSKLIVSDEIVANNAIFKKLSSDVANTIQLLSGNISSGTLSTIVLNTDNATIDSALISNLISNSAVIQKLISDYAVISHINTDDITISSEDGALQISGNLIQINDVSVDDNGNKVLTPRIQIGKDAQDNYTFVITDERGTTLFDSTGVHKDAIPDELITSRMIGDKAVTRDKMAFSFPETDENGNISAGSVKIDGTGMDVIYTNVQNSLGGLQSQINELEAVSDFSAETFATVGQFTDKTECGAVYTRVYKNGEELDPLPTLLFSDTAPLNPQNGDYYYKLDKIAKTATLMKFNGTSWVVVPEIYEYVYHYYRYDKRGNIIDTDEPYQTGRVVYIDPSIISGKMMFVCQIEGEVSGSEESGGTGSGSGSGNTGTQGGLNTDLSNISSAGLTKVRQIVDEQISILPKLEIISDEDGTLVLEGNTLNNK